MSNLQASQRHISSQFNKDLQGMHQRILRMGGMVQEQLAQALAALESNDSGAAEAVILRDHQINAEEVAIDEDCVTLIARRQPVASDLRLVFAAVKTITDLERIGDEAGRIARMAMHKAGDAYAGRLYVDISHLGDRVQDMLGKALDAFARMDDAAAIEVAKADLKVDQEYNGIMRQLVTYMMEDPRSIPTALDIMWSARALERIGDRSRNICEYVIYYVKGKDVRHTKFEQIEADLP
jgi:phosphate transport system protein